MIVLALTFSLKKTCKIATSEVIYSLFTNSGIIVVYKLASAHIKLTNMKKILCFTALLSIFILGACKKDSPGNDGTAVIRYDFTSTTAGNFNIETIADGATFVATLYTVSWTKTVNSYSASGVKNTSFTVFPPNDWANTNNVADVTLKIFVNNVEKASGTAHFIGLDRPNGITVTTVY